MNLKPSQILELSIFYIYKVDMLTISNHIITLKHQETYKLLLLPHPHGNVLLMVKICNGS